MRRNWIGIEPQARIKETPVSRGVLVGGLFPDSPAARVGIRPGDVVTELAGRAVDASMPEDLPAFHTLVASLPVGHMVTVNLVRASQPITVSVVTELWEPLRDEAEEVKEWGIAVRNMTQRLAREMKRRDVAGVLVLSLRSGGASEETRPPLRPRDVIVAINKRPVRSVLELRAITRDCIAGKEKPVPVMVTVERGTQRMLTVVDLGSERMWEEQAVAQGGWLGVAV